METRVALLRAINVGGRNRLPMADLRALCAELGWKEVATYIHSGNVVFRAPGTAASAEAALERGILESFGLTVPVVVRDATALARIVEENPFLEGGGEVPGLHVGFLKDEATAETLAAMPAQPPGPEELEVRGGEVFLSYPDGMGRSKLTTTWLDRALGTVVTVRNWRTVNTLLEMARPL